jgi:hypothetical protein
VQEKEMAFAMIQVANKYPHQSKGHLQSPPFMKYCTI